MNTRAKSKMSGFDSFMICMILFCALYAGIKSLEERPTAEHQDGDFRYFSIELDGTLRYGFINDGDQYVFCDGYSAEDFREEVVIQHEETCF